MLRGVKSDCDKNGKGQQGFSNRQQHYSSEQPLYSEGQQQLSKAPLLASEAA